MLPGEGEQSVSIDVLTNPQHMAKVLGGYKGGSELSDVARALREFDREGGMMYVKFGFEGSEIEFDSLENLANVMSHPSMVILEMRLEKCEKL